MKNHKTNKPDQKEQDIIDTLHRLSETFRQQIPKRIIEIKQTWHDLNLKNNPQAHEILFRITHSLAGTSASFGYAHISTAARDLEHSVTKIKNVCDIEPDLNAEIEQKILQLEHICHNVPDAEGL